MGELIRMNEYLERKAMERDPEQVRRRLAEIAIEQMVLASEKIRLQKVLDER